VPVVPPQDFEVDDLSDAIEELATGVYQVNRSTGATTYLDGVRVPPSTTASTILALVTPTSGRQLERLPEGLRSNETITIYTKTQLQTVAPTAEPDVVIYNGASYQVESVERWQQSGSFWVALAQRVKSL
jgi:hypothetical protein